jgi:uncharacterized cofD-like protein
MISRFFTKKKKVPLSLKNKKIVCIGGGTGLFSLLSGLKEYADSSRNIKAIVTTLDSGGSSGKLITQYGVLPPGDIRKCMVALSDESKILAELFQYRFDSKMNNHNFGNLLITTLSKITGDFASGVREASKILRIRGEVIPVSLEANTLIARCTDGRELVSEAVIDTTPDKKIEKIYLKEDGKTNPCVVRALIEADVIIFGPGDLYTSILPNLLFPKVRRAINSNLRAKKILISPVMSKPGETDDFVVSDFKREIEKYLKAPITHIVSNNHVPASVALNEYKKENKYPVAIDEENLKDIKLIKGNFIDEDKLVRHNPENLAKVIMKLVFSK